MVIDSYKAFKKFITDLSDLPKLLIHSCCAPCSSYVLDFLKDKFEITIFFYNPNIYPLTEHNLRLNEFVKLGEFPIITHDDDHEVFNQAIKGLEHLSEGSDRCFACYQFRLHKTALMAKAKTFDYFTTTLSISPYKNSKKINEIGQKISDEVGIKFLYSDFKKEEGYKKSIFLSKKYDLYRQEYCGCIYSYQEANTKRLY